MNTMYKAFNPVKFKFFLVFSFLFTSFSLSIAQVSSLEVLHQSSDYFGLIEYDETGIQWIESGEGGTRFQRLSNGSLTTNEMPNEYNCPISGYYRYQDYALLTLNNSPFTTDCNISVVLENNQIVEDNSNLGSPCTGYKNYVFLDQGRQGFTGSIFDVTTRVTTPLKLETSEYRYNPTNICTMDDTYIKFRAIKQDVNTGNNLGDAVVIYNWRTDQLQEVFLTPNFIHFFNKPAHGNKIAFTEGHPTFDSNLEKLHFFDGEQVHFITQDHIVNGWALPYLNGLAYITDNGVFYWEDGTISQLNTNGYSIAIDGNILSWFSSSNGTSKVHFYNGTTTNEIQLNGSPDQNSLRLFNGTSFLLVTTSADGIHSLVRGTHGFIAKIDLDNDGYESTVDCDDTNATINPGATEITNSGFDENCDGISLIIDNDNDGFNSSIDCDDNNASINAGATEIPNNGIDEDCNGADLITIENCTTGSSVAGTSPNGAAPKALNGNCSNLVVQLVAGSGNFNVSGSQNGQALQATFNSPEGLDIDGMGNIYVADQENRIIRKITPQGEVITLAGQSGVPGYRDGVGSTALFDEPTDVAVDFSGNVYVADIGNDVIRKITPSGIVSTYAGSGFQGNSDGIGANAQFILPKAVDIDEQGNLYVAELHRIRKIDNQQQVSTIATFPNGPDDAEFYSFSDLVIAPSGIIYVTNSNGRVIHQIAANGTSSILAGQLGVAVSQDGVGALATFSGSSGIEIDNCGNLFIVEGVKLRRITPDGIVTTIIDLELEGFSFLTDIIFDRAGNILVSDSGKHSLYRLGNCTIDGDLDGFIESTDCDDTNATRNSGAQEIPNSGIDENCDGISLIIDNDNDGFNSSIDCDDNNASINAGAIEIPNNGIDEDCNGTDLVQIIDNDNDGFAAEVDCDDNNASINPGAAEIANNGVDENCDGATLIIDFDGDGDNSSVDCDDNNAAINTRAVEIPDNGIDEDCNGSDLITKVDNDNDGYTNDVDCNDNNAAINPGAAEVTNSGFDENCDGVSLIIDNDNDGYNSSIDCDDNNASINSGAAEIANNGIDEDCNGSDLVTVLDNDNDGFTNDVDCNDNNAAINPGASEIANSGFDENCDGISLIIDSDNDGFNSSIDCDDNNASINAGATEIPNNGIDEDCNGADLTVVTDMDNDGFDSNVDCNDQNRFVNPGQEEITFNGIDENCDGKDFVECSIVDPLSDIPLLVTTVNGGHELSFLIETIEQGQLDGAIYYILKSEDREWIIDCLGNFISCDEGCNIPFESGIEALIWSNPDNDQDGFRNAVDCDDNNAAINPSAAEVTNSGFDENCDGISLIIDNDNDGYNSSIDCDDNNASINAGATEIANNGIDEDCNGSDLVTVMDNDNDGFTNDVDCNDGNPAINPGATEVANSGFDENCDGISLIIDNDNDGYNSSIDCDDNNPNINGRAEEIPNNGIDENCDGEDLTQVIDEDGDGFTTVVDCNDNDPNINPLAVEIPNNQIDEDCDGIALFIDEDQDGYHTDIDCDDTNPTVHNDAEEIPNNGIDENCDGEDLIQVIDEDGDGFTTVLDCNDNNPDINPLAEEILGNDVDENCDGLFTTSTLEQAIARQMELFPNPTTGIIYLKDNEYFPNNFRIVVHDYLGKSVYEQQVTKAPIMPIGIQQLNTGLFMLNIYTEYGVVSRKVLVTK